MKKFKVEVYESAHNRHYVTRYCDSYEECIAYIQHKQAWKFFWFATIAEFDMCWWELACIE